MWRGYLNIKKTFSILENGTSESKDCHDEDFTDVRGDLDTSNISEENDIPKLDDREAVIAAAVADFENDDDDCEDDTVNVIIKPTSKNSVYKTGTAYQARSVSHVIQRKKLY